MGRGSQPRARTLLGKLALGLLFVCFYIAGTNYMLYSSVVVRDVKNTNLDPNKFVTSNKNKKTEDDPVSGVRKTRIEKDPPADLRGPSKVFVHRQEANKDAILAQASKKAADFAKAASGLSKANPLTTLTEHHNLPPSKPVIDHDETDKKDAIIAEAGKKAAEVAKAASNFSTLNHSTPIQLSDPKPDPPLPATTKKTRDKPPPKPHLRDDAIYTCTYGTSKENRTTVVAPRNAPVFIIIGVQKSGSTALLTHFRDHPQMLQTKLKFRREAHFFDTSWQNGVIKPSAEMHMVGANDKNCLALEQYMKLFETETIMANSQTMAHDTGDNREHNNATHHLPLYTFEKTPSYFENPSIPSRVKNTVPWSKIILVLRNPIDRLYSSYKMTVRNNYSLRKYSMEDFVFHELKAMKKYNMTTAPLLVPANASNNNNFFDPSFQVVADHYRFPDAVPFDHAVMDPNAWNPKNRAIHKKTDGKDRDLGRNILLRRGLYSTQLKWWLKFYTVGKDLLVINYDDLAGDIQSVYERVCTFTGIPIPYGGNQTPADVGIDFAQKVRADDRKNDRPLRNDTRKYLGEFYAPYTAELKELLGPEWSSDKLGWN